MEHHPFKLSSEFEPQGDHLKRLKRLQTALKQVNVIKPYWVPQVQVRPLR